MIKNLTKKFYNFTAVDHITFSIKEGEVFSILGHNGAGKTTLINMLTGMFGCTSGEALIYGKSMKYEMDFIQRDIGLC